MNLVNDGIQNVKVLALPVGIGADGSVICQPRCVLVRWQSSWDDKFYQVYINGHYAGSTVDTEEREMLIQFPSSWQRAVKIEVFAVEPSVATMDLSGALETSNYKSGRVKISCLRANNLSYGATIQYYSNNGDGNIDYDTALLGQPRRIWSAWQDKGGFGMSKFGNSDFGYDGSAAIGFGRGLFGNGEFGFDVDDFNWISEELETGKYKFGMKVKDVFGNAAEDTIETDEIVLICDAKPAEKLEIGSYDKIENDLVLSIT